MQPRPQHRRQADDYEVHRTEHPALEHMPVLVAHRQLLTRPDDDILTEGDAAREGVEEVEADAAQPVPRLPFENQQEQQPQKVLRKLPQVQQYCTERPHGYSLMYLQYSIRAIHPRTSPAAPTMMVITVAPKDAYLR